MVVDQAAAVALTIFAAGQLVYAGAALQMLRQHERRIDANEADIKDLSKVTAQLAAKEGIPI